ncbi:DUF4956 domain-containing protein [Kineococcus rubinsiae]|uniref:DUF4956 domain-containing protein n=1 Tax=Kineococcus rubinsiae TaxID=2609562 RepID=UPI0014302BC0|nr:DUF4956 domain-containing protein [Kineococcus rubinsiae]NIZ89729.1 DUF4956 domain-containing protein [Kineococcus rubinsiae]
MAPYVLPLADLAGITILVFGLFLPRHRRPELVVAFLTTNVGVLAVSAALASSTIGAGLGLGLFGILSIIRLRSEELSQHEVAYYFAALALGLLGGLSAGADLVDLALMAAVLAAVAIGDHPRVSPRTRSQQLLLDRAHTDETALRHHLEALVGGPVLATKVLRTDLVNDTTLVDVRYRPPAAAETAPAVVPAERFEPHRVESLR